MILPLALLMTVFSISSRLVNFPLVLTLKVLFPAVIFPPGILTASLLDTSNYQIKWYSERQQYDLVLGQSAPLHPVLQIFLLSLGPRLSPTGLASLLLVFSVLDKRRFSLTRAIWRMFTSLGSTLRISIEKISSGRIIALMHLPLVLLPGIYCPHSLHIFELYPDYS